MQWPLAEGLEFLFPSVLDGEKGGTGADAGADNQPSNPPAGGGRGT